MIGRRMLAGGLLLGLALTAPALADRTEALLDRALRLGERQQQGAQRAFTSGRVRVEGEALEQAVERVVGLGWHGSADAALTAARASGKPVLLIQALGSLDGLT